MTLLQTTAFNPWKEIDRFLGGDPRGAAWRPAFDILETDDAYLLRGDLPGIPQKEIEVRLEDGVLTVSGDRSLPVPEGEPRALRRQRPSGKFRRRFILPEDVNGDEIKATYARGVLELAIPKAAPVDRSRLITVN